MPPEPDLDELIATRRSLHTIAEHILAAALHAATGRIGLRVHPGGFATPPFDSPGHGRQQLIVEGVDLVVRDDLGERRAPLITVGSAAELAGLDPSRSTIGEVYELATRLDLDAALAIVPAAADELSTFFGVANEALESMRAEHLSSDPSIVQLWPEHFDVGTSFSEINFGGSPGDEQHPRPYLYVGPWSPPVPDGDVWNEPFGSSRAWDRTTTAADGFAYFERGWRARKRTAGDGST